MMHGESLPVNKSEITFVDNQCENPTGLPVGVVRAKLLSKYGVDDKPSEVEKPDDVDDEVDDNKQE